MIERRKLPLSALRAFESAATTLHLGNAGKALGVTHGAISHQIRQLEDQLGIELFSRVRNRLELTPAGVQLFEAVKEGFDRIIEGAHKLNPDELKGSLVIGCTQTIATSWATKHICEFQQKYPMIQIIVREIEPRQISIPYDIDIAICYGLPKSESKRIYKLASPQLFPVCNPAILGDRSQMKKARNFAEITLLHDSQVAWNRWFENFGIPTTDLTRNIYFSNTSQALTAARLGYGVALCNTFETQEFIRQGQLVRLGQDSIEEENSYFLLSHNKEKISLKSSLFEKWIIDACTPGDAP